MTAEQLCCVLPFASQPCHQVVMWVGQSMKTFFRPKVQTIRAALAGPGCTAGSETLLWEREAEALEPVLGETRSLAFFKLRERIPVLLTQLLPAAKNNCNFGCEPPHRMLFLFHM